MTKPMKVLIAYDGSPCADEAIEDLQRAGLPNNVDALVLSVADIWLLPSGDLIPFVPTHLASGMAGTQATAEALLAAAQLRAEAACERLRANFPTWHIQAKSLANSPAWAIVLEAESWQADLIVVGSHGYSALNRWILGSVSQTVLTHAPCSVRIGRGRPMSGDRPLRILVGIDGSAEAETATHIVAERVWPVGTDIRLIMVLEASILASINRPPKDQVADDTVNDGAKDGAKHAIEDDAIEDNAIEDDAIEDNAIEDNAIENIEDEVNRILDRHLAIFAQKPPQLYVSTMLVPGDPRRVLVEEAERWGADSIVIGARGLNPWERLLLGSVSSAVAARAHCPVEVVRS